MKKLKFILLLLVIITFSSCISDDTEIRNRLIIEGIGIDFDTRTDEYIITVQALSTAAAGNGQSEGTSTPVTNFTVRGRSVASALGSLCENTGRNPLYSQNRVIILGSQIDKSSVAAALDYLVREYTARPDVYVAAATGKASDILEIQSDGEIPAKIIEESIDRSDENSLTKSTQLYNLVNLRSEKTTAPTLPLLEIDKDRNRNSDTVRVTGTCVITEKDKKNHLSSEETVMFRIITDDVSQGTINISLNGKNAGLDIIKSDTDISVSITDGQPHFSVKIKCSLDLVEYGTSDFGSIARRDIDSLREVAENHISSGVRQVLERQLKEEKCDIFRFGKYLEFTFPDVYTSLSSDWENALPSFTYDISSDVTIRKIGQETLKNP